MVLKGIRRSGKSTIIKQLIHELIKSGINKRQVLYLNLEDYSFANDLNLNLFEDVLKAYKEYNKPDKSASSKRDDQKRIYFFIDEIQKISGWERWIRTKYDLNENIKFVISGSSASLLSKELSTLLTGRNLSFVIMPLSFNEYVHFTKDNENLDEYMKYGGFPEVVLEKSEEKKVYLLKQYFEDIIHKDIIDRFAIRNTKQVLDLARYLVSTSGSKVSVNKLSKIFGLSKDTLRTYINYMIDSYLLFEVTYFSYSAKVRHDVTKLPKLYCLDSGFMNVVNTRYSQNLGQVFENTVLIKLAQIHREISYWSELNTEVDFIVEKTAINVTAADKIPEREQKGLEEFKKKHREFDLLLISRAQSNENMTPILEFLRQE
ncbi:MAG: ATP-binding protein [Nanoarchaeota archaeon]